VKGDHVTAAVLIVRFSSDGEGTGRFRVTRTGDLSGFDEDVLVTASWEVVLGAVREWLAEVNAA
jgi:hypothetical protein